MKQKELPPITIPIILIIASLVILLMGYFNFKHFFDMKRNGIKTDAIITELSEQSRRSKDRANLGKKVYTANVAYVTKEGKEIKVWHKHEGNYSKADINTKVVIYYNPVDPQKIIWEYEKFNVAFPVIGFLFFAGGILAFRHVRKTAKK